MTVTTTKERNRASARPALAAWIFVLFLAGVLGLPPSARAATTINSGATFTIDDSNTTLAASVRTWNETGVLTIRGGGTLQTRPSQTPTVANNASIVFADLNSGISNTLALRFNGNDSHFTFSGPITSTATVAQTLTVFTGYSGNGDRESVTFNSAIPNTGNGSALSLQVTFQTQTGSQSYVSLPASNTFTGPITLLKGNSVITSYFTIGGVRTNAGSTPGTGKLGGGNYPGNIALATTTILNYLSSATQTLSGAISGAGSLSVGGGGTVTLSGVSTFAGNTTIAAGSALVLASTTGDYKFTVTDTTTNKITGGGTATLNGKFTIDSSAVTVTSGSWTLVDATTKSFGGTFNLAGFTGPVSNVHTKVIGGQNWTFNTTTGVLGLTSKAIITSFGIPGSTGVINQVAKTISLTVPYGTSLSTLAPTFTLTTGTCNPVSGVAPSPSFAAANPATYTVTDGATVNNYAVTVSVTPASSLKDILTCDFGALGAATITGTSIVLTVPPSQAVTALAPTFTISQFATVSPASGSTQNFTNPVTYTVTAQNGTTKVYTVTVQTYAAWAHFGSLYIITTPEGANIPAGATETNFPLLVRLSSANFNFSEAQSDGRDIRFTTAAGAALSYQIEQWDAVNEVASIWVKVPTITGNARQEIKMYWGKSGVPAESNGAAVFNAANGYAAVIHMNETVVDEVGSVSPSNSGTTLATGMIGKGRNFAAGQGISCGTNITSFPTGANFHSTQAWFRTDAVNTTVVGWGQEQGQGKVVMQLASPLHVKVDCYFSGGSVTGGSTLPMGQWAHAVHTYQNGAAKLYVNGVLDGSSSGAAMNIPSPAQMLIGGWGGYSFAGDMDEVRISKVTRSANWVKMEYENQKPLQTMLGTLVQAGSTFSAAPASVTMNEGTSANFTGQAGGAQKVYWIYKVGAQETVLAVDQFTLNVAAGRVTGSQAYVIQFKGIYPAGIQTVDIPVTVTESIPDPIFTLTSPDTWNGRDTITVTPNISNLVAMQAAGAGTLNYKWSVNGVAVLKQISPGVLTLLRSQGSGAMTVSLTMDNGGGPVTVTKIITVQEPASDAWVQRTPVANEKPVNNQFFARDNTGFGTIYYWGTQAAPATEVYLKIYKTETGSDVIYSTQYQTLVATAYSFAVPIAAGKFNYKVTYGTRSGGVDSAPLATVTNLLCGDAYIIEGQSNALATDNSAPNDSTTDPWIRTYGLTLGWGSAISKGSELQLGLWGWYLAKRLTVNDNMPICIINAAVGGTRIDQHMPNPAGRGTAGSLYSIYANLYNRVVGAKLTHGIRGVLWHQGEQDQGAGGPDGDYDYKFYQQYFVDMSAAWKQDFPNIRNYYVFQIWPAACGDVSRNDQLREVQRSLSRLYSNMRVMSTLGIVPGSSCHYGAAGYQVFSDLIGPLVEVDHYGYVPAAPVTAPDLKRAYFTTATNNEVTLDFGQNMAWNLATASSLFFLADVNGTAVGTVTGGSVSGNLVRVNVTGAAAATTITYLKGTVSWNQTNILKGTNGIAALTFADVAIAPPAPTGLSATAGSNQVALSWTASAGATGYNVRRATTNGGPYTTIGTAVGTSYTDTGVTSGTTYYYVVSATVTSGESPDSTQVSATVPASPYAAWAAAPAQGLTAGLNDGPLDDPERDGISNLLEFILTGAPMTSSTAVLPKLSRTLGGTWVFEYDRSTASVSSTTQVVEYGADFAGWTLIPVTATSGGAVTITPGTQTDRVSVVIPAGSGKQFVRLRVTK